MSLRSLPSLPREATSLKVERKAPPETPPLPIQAALPISRVPLSACSTGPFHSPSAWPRPRPHSPLLGPVRAGPGFPYFLCPLRPQDRSGLASSLRRAPQLSVRPQLRSGRSLLLPRL